MYDPKSKRHSTIKLPTEMTIIRVAVFTLCALALVALIELLIPSPRGIFDTAPIYPQSSTQLFPRYPPDHTTASSINTDTSDHEQIHFRESMTAHEEGGRPSAEMWRESSMHAQLGGRRPGDVQTKLAHDKLHSLGSRLGQAHTHAGSLASHTRAEMDQIVIWCADSSECLRHALAQTVDFWKELDLHAIFVQYLTPTLPPELASDAGEGASGGGLGKRKGWLWFRGQNYPATISAVDLQHVNPNSAIAVEYAVLAFYNSQPLIDRFVVVTSLATSIVPSRLVEALDLLSRRAPKLYSGRPQSTCDCTQGQQGSGSGGADCSYRNVVHFCSSWFYITNTATLSKLTHASLSAGQSACPRVSGAAMGGAMRAEHGIGCTPAIWTSDTDIAPAVGISWTMAVDGVGVKSEHHVCFGSTTAGSGVVRWTKPEKDACIAFHPVASVLDSRLLQYDVLKVAEELDTCELGLVIPSPVNAVEARQAARLTWFPLAKHLGIRPKFIVGTDAIENRRTVEQMLRFEPDLLATSVPDDNKHDTAKVIEGLTYFHRETDCPMVGITLQDTYVRPVQLLRLLQDVNPREGIWLGHALGTRFSNSNDLDETLRKCDPEALFDAAKSMVVASHGPRVQSPLGIDGEESGSNGGASSQFNNNKASGSMLRFQKARIPDHASGVFSVMTRGLLTHISLHLPAVRRTFPFPIALGSAFKSIIPKVTLIDTPELSARECGEDSALAHPAFSRGFWNIYQRHECELRDAFCACQLAGNSVDANERAVMLDPYSLAGVGGETNMDFASLSVAPWDDPSLVPSAFHILSSDLEKVTFSSRFNLAAHDMLEGVSKRLKLLKHGQSALCTSCHIPWRIVYYPQTKAMVSYVPSTERPHMKALSVKQIDKKSQLFDIVVPFACQTDRLEVLIDNIMQGGKKLGIRPPQIVVSWSPCPARPNEQMHNVLARYLDENPARAEFVLMVEGPPAFSRGPSLNAGIEAARSNSVVIALDVDMKIKNSAISNCFFFSSPGVSMYFPIVFSEFEPSSIDRISEFFGKPVGESSPFRGTWRPYGYGMFCGWGSDLKTLQFEDMHGWGGEDNAYFEVARSKFSIVRMTDIGFLHAWHSKNCDAANEASYKACLASLGVNSQSSLAWSLEMEGTRKERAQRAAVAPQSETESKPLQDGLLSYGQVDGEEESDQWAEGEYDITQASSPAEVVTGLFKWILG